MPENHMNTEQQNRQPAGKKPTPTDIILILLGILILFRTPWNNMNSFHYLLFFLYALCMILRIGNMRKDRMRQMAIARREATAKAIAKENTEAAENAEAPENKDNTNP